MQNLFFVLLVIWACAGRDFSGLKNARVNRNIDLTEQIVKITYDILVENVGSSSAKSYFLALEKDVGSKVSSMTSTIESATKPVKLVSGPTQGADYYLYEVEHTIPAGGKLDIFVEAHLTHALSPHPKIINQPDPHRVRYYDNHYFFSPYPSAHVKTKVKTVEAGIISHSEQAPTSQGSDDVTFGPYPSVAPFSSSKMTIHFFSAAPFLTVRSLQRHVEVSHWGNIAIEESYDVAHEGAQLKEGLFSRFSYQTGMPIPTLIPGFSLFLHKDTRDVYYRDEIGNITTSNYVADTDPQVINLRPRFPLMGGWHTEFKFGYNLPSTALLTSNGKFTLTVPFLPHWKDQAIFDHVDLKIVLPEGASNIQHNAPFDVSVRTEKLLTYLDVNAFGRNVVVLSKNNVHDYHRQDIQITYDFSSSSLIFEPTLLVGFFFGLFTFFMLVSRINLQIYPADTTSH